ncbi:MAG: TolC family protein [Deltaproteobacteria bacterium]|nr:TolC family protein [Deltaproteobacteria bacterium]
MLSFKIDKRHIMYRLIIALILAFTIPGNASAEEMIGKGERLNLDKCIEIALKKHPQILAALSTLDVKKSNVGQALAGYYPQINWQAGMSRNAAPLVANQYNQYSHSLSLSQNIYDFNKVGARVDIQSFNLEAAQADLENVKLNVILGVKLAYYEALRAKHARDINADTVKQFEERLETAKGFFEAGAKPIFDVTKAEVDLGNARINMVKANNAVIIAFVNLNNALGMPAAPSYELVDYTAYEKTAVDLSESLNRAMLNRPDLQSLLRQIEAAQKAIQLARKDYLPTLSGSANYGWSGQELPLDRGWDIGATLNFNVFSGFLTKHQVGAALAGVEVTRAVEETLRQTIRLEVEQALANIQAAEKSIDAAAIMVRQATENYGLAQGRYAAGVGVPMELTDAVVALGNARLALSGAIYDQMGSVASLQKAMGAK